MPDLPGKRHEDWEIDDPAGKDLEAVRRVRDDTSAPAFDTLLAELARAR